MIGGFQSCSFIDFPGHLAAVVFTRGCNLRCGYCHNPDLCGTPMTDNGDYSEILPFMGSRMGKLTGIVVSGGEPTLHHNLPFLLEAIRKRGFAVKLDTNGTLPEVLRRLLQEHLVDFLAVDVKVPPATTSLRLCGVEGQAESALESLGLAVESGIPHEARTTVVDVLHDSDGLIRTARALASAGVSSWRLQPVRDGRVLDPSVKFVPPQADVLSQAVDEAIALGLEASVGKSPSINYRGAPRESRNDHQ